MDLKINKVYCFFEQSGTFKNEFRKLGIDAETDAYFAVRYQSRDEWKANRNRNPRTGGLTVGGSDAPVVEGISSFKSAQELMDELRGEVEPPNLDGNPNIQRGVQSEPLIRQLFAVEHPEYQVVDGTGIVFYSKIYPWASASLDGILLDSMSGERGSHEIKSVMYSSKWKGDFAPDDYFIQVVHQMMVTGFDFGILHARVIGRWTHDRLFKFMRQDILEQGEQLMEDERRFVESVKTGKPLPYKIPTL